MDRAATTARIKPPARGHRRRGAPGVQARRPVGRGLRVFTGSAHPALGEAIARFLGVPLGRAHLARFSDGEVWFQIQDNVRGADVFVVQPTGAPVNENLMELLVMLDAFKRSSASRITAVMPYYGYARQ